MSKRTAPNFSRIVASWEPYFRSLEQIEKADPQDGPARHGRKPSRTLPVGEENHSPRQEMFPGW